MKKTLTSAHLRERFGLRSRCLMIVEFAHEHSGLGEFAVEIRKVIEDAYATQDLKGLRMVGRDLEEMADGLSPRAKAELDRRLEAALGIDMKVELAMDKLTIEAMIRRGRIRNEREYRLALAFLDRVAGTDEPGAARAYAAGGCLWRGRGRIVIRVRSEKVSGETELDYRSLATRIAEIG